MQIQTGRSGPRGSKGEMSSVWGGHSRNTYPHTHSLYRIREESGRHRMAGGKPETRGMQLDGLDLWRYGRNPNNGI